MSGLPSPSATPNPPWDAGPPDGAIAMSDVLAVLAQAGLGCNTPPNEEQVAYTYDANGNQTGRGSDAFTYDHENRLIDAVIGRTTSTYTYNGDGLRVSRSVDGAATDYTWGVGSALPVILQETAGGQITYYVYGLGLIASIEGAAVTYYLTDGLGSTTELADSGGSVTDTYRYDVFGALRPESETVETDFLFTGQQRDSETGFYYLRARYYDPAGGRFFSRDPYPLLQSYAYAANNPVKYIDPSGLCIFGAPCPAPLGTARDWVGDRLGDAGAVAVHTATHPWTLFNGNLTNEIIGGAIAALSSCDRDQKEGGVVVYQNCGGVAGWISQYITGGRTYTIGSFVFSPGRLSDDLLRHEMAHVAQYDVLGSDLLPVYGIIGIPLWVGCGFDRECAGSLHPLERLADWQAGTDVR